MAGSRFPSPLFPLLSFFPLLKDAEKNLPPHPVTLNESVGDASICRDFSPFNDLWRRPLFSPPPPGTVFFYPDDLPWIVEGKYLADDFFLFSFLPWPKFSFFLSLPPLDFCESGGTPLGSLFHTVLFFPLPAGGMGYLSLFSTFGCRVLHIGSIKPL